MPAKTRGGKNIKKMRMLISIGIKNLRGKEVGRNRNKMSKSGIKARTKRMRNQKKMGCLKNKRMARVIAKFILKKRCPKVSKVRDKVIQKSASQVQTGYTRKEVKKMSKILFWISTKVRKTGKMM